MVAQHKQAYTLEDLRAIEALPENADKYFELINGEIHEVATPSPLHNFIVAQIVFFLLTFVRTHNLGFVFGDATSYTLANGDELIPDASFISKERQALPLPSKFYIAPDLAVEVVSPSNQEREMLNKAESYLQSGTRLVWIIYPKTQIVDAIRLTEQGKLSVQKIAFDGALDGEDVLPGFSLPVKDIFPPQE
ncbi:MAG: Uma2 family endonuclease [Chloroflexota bacterium]